MSKLLSLIILLLLFVSEILAAGSRYVIENSGGGTVDGGGIRLKVKIYQDDAKFNPSKLEDVDFRIKEPREGDKCEQKADKTDDSGIIEAVCYAKQVGSYNVYIKSNDKGDESGEFVLSFGPKPNPTSTPVPVVVTTSAAQEEEKESQTASIEAVKKTVKEVNIPTPTPPVEVAGFFSKPGNQLAILIGIISIVFLVLILQKAKIINLGKFKKKEEPEKVDTTGIYPPDEANPA